MACTQASQWCERHAEPLEPDPLNPLNLLHPLNLCDSVLRWALDAVDDEELTGTTGRLEPKAELLAQRGEYRDACCCGIVGGARRSEFELDVEQTRKTRAIDDTAFGE